jgi:hypothetical protein
MIKSKLVQLGSFSTAKDLQAAFPALQPPMLTNSMVVNPDI